MRRSRPFASWPGNDHRLFRPDRIRSFAEKTDAVTSKEEGVHGGSLDYSASKRTATSKGCPVVAVERLRRRQHPLRIAPRHLGARRARSGSRVSGRATISRGIAAIAITPTPVSAAAQWTSHVLFGARGKNNPIATTARSRLLEKGRRETTPSNGTGPRHAIRFRIQFELIEEPWPEGNPKSKPFANASARRGPRERLGVDRRRAVAQSKRDVIARRQRDDGGWRQRSFARGASTPHRLRCADELALDCVTLHGAHDEGRREPRAVAHMHVFVGRLPIQSRMSVRPF